MDTFNPFSLRYHNRDGGTSAAPVARVPIGDGGDVILTGDPVQVEAGVAAAYTAGNGVFGVALYAFPNWNAHERKDSGDINHPLIYPIQAGEHRFKVQAYNYLSESPDPVTQDVLGNAFNLGGSAGEMHLNVQVAGTDFLVVDIERTVSEWGDLYPILIVQCINPQHVDPTL